MKKMIKKITTMILCSSLILPYFTTTSNAMKFTAGPVEKNIYVKDRVTGKKHYTSQYIKDEQGNHVYCMNSVRKAPNNMDFPEGGVLDEVAYRILMNGYPNKSFTGDPLKDRIITQAAFWCYVDSSTVSYNNLVAISNGKEDPEMLNHIRNLYQSGKNGKDRTIQTFSFSQTSGVAKLEGDNFVSDYITLNTNETLARNLQVGITMQNAKEGVYLQNKSGQKIMTIRHGEAFRVVIPKSIASGSITLTGNGTAEVRTAIWYKSTNDKYQNLGKYAWKNSTMRSSDSFTVTWKGEGNIVVNKKDKATGQLLSNAQFEITDNNGNVVQKVTTDGTGTAKSVALPVGNQYYVKEIAPPSGYTICNEKHPVTISTVGSVYVTCYNDKIKGSIEITKVDKENNAKLKGAEFTIYDSSNKAVQVLTTDANGYAKSQMLNFGKYTVKETKAPIGYIKSEEVYSLDVKDNNQSIKLNIVNNVIKGKIQIVKVDSTNKEVKVAGAKFSITDKQSGKVVQEITTNKDGIATSSDLRYGEYIIKETQAPEGYWKTDEEYTVNLIENTKIYIKEISNKPIQAKLKIIKTDSSNSLPIANVKFKIVDVKTNKDVIMKDAEGKDISEFITNNNGEIITPQLLNYGSYKLVEVQEAQGYLKGAEIPFKIDKDAPYKEVDVDASVVKNMSMDEAVEYIEENFDILNDDAQTTFNLLTENNEIMFKLETLESELEKEAEYKLEKDIKFMSFEEKNEVLEDNGISKLNSVKELVLEIKVENTRIAAPVEIIKVDSKTKQPLEGVEFKIECLDGLDKGKILNVVTDDKGLINLNLPYGKYQIVEEKTLEGYVLDTEARQFSVEENNKTIKLNIENSKIVSDVKLIKLEEESEKKLKGAKFELYRKNKELEIFEKLNEYTSDENGEIKIEGLEYGEYYFIEVEAPEGYILEGGFDNEKRIEFEVVENAKTIELKAYNKIKMGELDFSKTDLVTGDIVEGAKIEIIGISETNNHIKIEFESSKEGNRFKLPYGKYEFRETLAPDGYVQSTEVGIFEIKEDGEIVKAELKNKPILGSVEILKVDAQDKKKVLQGAEFAIYNSEGTELFMKTTDAKGLIVFDNLRAGKYTIKELKAPKGYELRENGFEVEIKEDGKVLTYQVDNQARLVQTGGMFNENIYMVVGIACIMIGCGVIIIGKRKNN